MIALPHQLFSPATIQAAANELARRDWANVCSHPAAFRNVLLIDRGAGAVGLLGPSMDPWQRMDFEAMDDAWLTVVGRGIRRPQRCMSYRERGRGHSKTTDIACSATWALLSSPRKIRGVVASGKKDQAGFVREAIDTLLRLNNWLGDALEVNKWEVINKRTGSTLSILASESTTNFGATPDFTIVDELTHWENEALWTAIFSALAKRPMAVLEVIANAGEGRGKELKPGQSVADIGGSWHWRVREACRVDQGFYFNRLEGPVASWITPESLAAQRRILSPRAYARLWLNIWQVDGGDAINMEDVDACTTLLGPVNDCSSYAVGIGGLDLAVAKHFAAFVVVGLDLHRRRVKLIHTRRWRPRDFETGRISLAQVRADVLEDCRRLNVIGIAYDPAKAELMAEDIAKAGVPCFEQLFTPKEANGMAVALLTALRERQMDLYPCPMLMRDLANLSIATRSHGLKLEAPEDDEGGHCDVGIALSIALPWAFATLEDYA